MPPPSKPTTTPASNHQEKPTKKTTTDLAIVDLEIHQPWQQSHHTNRQRRGRWRENREERGWVRLNKILFLVLELCYSAILKVELHCSSIAKKFAILGVSIPWCRAFWGLKCQILLTFGISIPWCRAFWGLKCQIPLTFGISIPQC